MILDLVAKRARALVSARAVIVELAEGGRLQVAAVAGEIHPELAGASLDPDESVAAGALESHSTERLGKAGRPELIGGYGDGRHGFGFEVALVVPLVMRGTVHGALIALDPQADRSHFTGQDEEVLEGFAASATIALATARSVGAERRRARLAAGEADRARWARELHDGTLAGLDKLTRMLEAIAVADQEEASRLGHAAAGRLESEVARLRYLITELRPLDLDRKGAGPALEKLVADLIDRGVDIGLTIDLAYEAGRHPCRHTTELETALYRIVQEGLRNAATHAPAAHVEVEVLDDEDADEAIVRVADDGPGFDQGAARPGSGLQSIRERVDLLGGRLTIHSTASEGTEIVARMPVRRRSVTAMRESLHPEQAG